MKKIEAVILRLHLNAVRRELQRCGIGSGLTVVEVRHSDSDKRFTPPENGVNRALQGRVKLELIVDDSEADKTVNVILRHARAESDQEGGQIAVLEVKKILRIRGSLIGVWTDADGRVGNWET
jgi:nitrogen regulatory protein PII